MISGLASYGRAYEAQKGSRKLDWMTGVGSVEMEIHLDGLITTINVSPAHTAVLAQFTKKGFRISIFIVFLDYFVICRLK